MGLDRDMELVFQERHNLKHSDGIKDSRRHQWGRVCQRRGIFSGQELVKNECFYRSFDILRVHKGFSIRSAGQSLFQLVTAFVEAIFAACPAN